MQNVEFHSSKNFHSASTVHKLKILARYYDFFIVTYNKKLHE